MLHSCNLYPLVRVSKRYQLDSEKLFNIILDFLSHRRGEILNAQLSRWFNPFDAANIKSELQPIIYELMSVLDHTDNVQGFFIQNNQLYIKDYPDDHEPE